MHIQQVEWRAREKKKKKKKKLMLLLRYQIGDNKYQRNKTNNYKGLLGLFFFLAF